MPTFAVADSLAISDSLRLISPEIAVGLLADPIYFLDTVSNPTLGLTVGVADTLSFLEATQNAFKFVLPFPAPGAPPDRILLIDTAEVSLNSGQLQVLAGDILNFNDNRAQSNTNSTVSADALSLTDSTLNLRGFGVAPDTLSLSDSAANSLNSVFLNLTEFPSDSLGLNDSIRVLVPGGRVSVGNTLQLSDAVFVALFSTFKPYIRRYLNDVQ